MRKPAGLTFLLISSSLFASQFFYQGVSLRDLIRQSPVILLAHPAHPFYVTNTIKIKCKLTKNVKLDLEREKYVVEQVLQGKYPGLTKRAVITVHPAEEDRYISQTRLYECQGITESVMVDSYAGRKIFSETDSRVLFLYMSDKEYYETIVGAKESPDRMEEIKRYIQERYTAP